AAKIRVNPRGNLWATGHFMGKKSLTSPPRLEPPEEPARPVVFGPSLRALLEDMVELLTRELLKILLQERLLDESRGRYDLAAQ
ncbi:NMB protein, partial [Eurystomus gularis]|nr:NMB protein [Eurystomus gularis]